VERNGAGVVLINAPGVFFHSTWELIMTSLIAAAKVFASDEEGITAIEYGLIAATMVAAVVAAFSFLRPALETAFETIADKITGNTTP
jgi:pilus assembly protein Flp/PilA